MTVDKQLKQMMHDLGRALVNAISTSPKAGDAVEKIHRKGYSLFLVLDRDEGAEGPQIELAAGGRKPARRPAFLLNQSDVSFLESVGIDATRPGKRRRTGS